MVQPNLTNSTIMSTYNNVTPNDIVDTAVQLKHHDHYDDIVGIAQRILPAYPEKVGVLEVARFMIQYNQMWFDVHNEDPYRQSGKMAGSRTLYIDPGHKKLNSNVRPIDYLVTFKNFTRKWAARKKGSDAEHDWDKAQDELAEYIARELGLMDNK